MTEFAWVSVRVFFLRRGRVGFSSVYFFFFFAALEYYLPGCFHIARHLAAESGTRFLLPCVYVIFAGGDSWLGVVLLCLFLLVSAIFIVCW